MLKYFFSFILLLVIGRIQILCQNKEKIILDFVRVIDRDSKVEEVKGLLCTQENGKIFIDVKEPVDQWIIIEDKLTIIYYPIEKRAFRFFKNNPLLLPFHQSIFGFQNDNIDLSKLGYRIVKKETKTDSLFIFWRQFEGKYGLDDIVITLIAHDHLASIEVKDGKGNTKSKSNYSNYFRYKNNFFPLDIQTIFYNNDSRFSEKVIYSKPKTNSAFSQEIIDFKIPSDAIVKDIEW